MKIVDNLILLFIRQKLLTIEKISAIQDLLNDWENKKNCTAKISGGYRQIVMFKQLKTILSVEELTTFEYDSYLLLAKLDMQSLSKIPPKIGISIGHKQTLNNITDLYNKVVVFLKSVSVNERDNKENQYKLEAFNRQAEFMINQLNEIKF